MPVTSSSQMSDRDLMVALRRAMEPPHEKDRKIGRQEYYDCRSHVEHLRVSRVVGDEIDGIGPLGVEMRLHIPRKIDFRPEHERGDGEVHEDRPLQVVPGRFCRPYAPA